jgi:hypothetical protein
MALLRVTFIISKSGLLFSLPFTYHQICLENALLITCSLHLKQSQLLPALHCSGQFKTWLHCIMAVALG